MFEQPNDRTIERAYNPAKERYAQLGVDTESAIGRLAEVAISLPAWQGHDVSGFETQEGLSDGGIIATGAYPGKARTADELRADVSKALSLIPGTHRLNLHSICAETGAKRAERDELLPEHFISWIDWAKTEVAGIDFNPTFFSHPKATDGFTLASRDDNIRRFWVRHGMACRRIAEHIGKELRSASVNNIWVPDGYKDTPVDRKKPREILKKSLDEIFSEKLDRTFLLDSVEGKLFGIGSESYVVGSHEFYMGYAIANDVLLCLDSGHFHQSEVVSDKISSVLSHVDELLLHVSRGVRWDSDHVVVMSDELLAIAQEIVRGDYLGRVHIGLDFFDASINRIAAWIIGARCMIKSLLIALLEPVQMLRDMENSSDLTGRLAMLEELKTMPFAAVWDYYCLKQGVPVGPVWLNEVRQYEKSVLAARQ